MAGGAWHGAGVSTPSFRASVAESSHFGLKPFRGRFLDAATARSMTEGARSMAGLVRALKRSAELDAPDARLARRGEVPKGFVYRYRKGVREIVFVGEIAREDTR